MKKSILGGAALASLDDHSLGGLLISRRGPTPRRRRSLRRSTGPASTIRAMGGYAFDSSNGGGFRGGTVGDPRQASQFVFVY